MITFNNPDRAKERKNAKPITENDKANIISLINSDDCDRYNSLQSLIDNYENLKHFSNVVGGWEGYSKLINNYEVIL